MKVRFIQAEFVGSRSYAPGEAAELPDEQAKRVIEAGRARPVAADETVETATLTETNDTATVRTTKAAKGRKA